MSYPGLKETNDPSNLLTPEENETVFTVVGHRKLSKATAVVQMFHAYPDRSQWSKFKTGVVCFVKDNVKKSYYIRLVDIMSKSVLYEQEMYNQLVYRTDRPFFHTFAGDKFMVGLNFADDDEADKFAAAVNAKIQERQVKTHRRNTLRKGEGAAPIDRPPISPVNDASADPFSGLNKQGRPKRPRGKKITKSDIGLPSDFRHLAHVGFDPKTGAFDSSNISPDWKQLLDMVGVTNEQLQDKNTANFIYDFVEKHGGIQEANRQLQQSAMTKPPPPPSRGRAPPPPSSSRHGRPPPPPARESAPPPPPTRDMPHPSGGRGNVPPPPPPPPIGAPAPPPPPPPVGGGESRSAPPPPPPSNAKPRNLPAVDGARSDLLSSIRNFKAVAQLKSVTDDDRDMDQSPTEELDGMAGALARALAKRSNVIHGQEQSDESEEEWDDDEEEEWASN